jgi:hypothetical protein
MNQKISLNIGPLMLQLFEISAKIDALKDCVLDMKDDEVRKKYSESFDKHFKRIVNDFDELNPGIIESNPFANKPS